MRKQFRDTVVKLAAEDDKVVVVFGDISVYMFSEFREKYPDRFFNLGIAENTLISATAGLSAEGFYPFTHTIAPFITERCLEQIKLDMVYNAFGGNIVTCGASFDYAWDGPSHFAYSDMAVLRLLPGIEIMQPGSKKETDLLIRSQYRNGRTSYFRLSEHAHNLDVPVEFGKGVIVKDKGSDTTIMTAGPILGNVLAACESFDVNIVYFHTIKPIDEELILRFRDTKIMVIHDAFGLHEAVCAIPGLSVSYHGLKDSFSVTYGNVHDMRRKIGLDPDSIEKVVKQRMREKQHVMHTRESQRVRIA